MRDLISKGLLTAAAATSVLSMSGYAHAADANGAATDSPGLLSGNSIQAPLDIPINVCGNSVNVVGAGNPAFGNGCANTSDGPQHMSHYAPSHDAPRPADQSPHAGPAGHTAPAPRPAPEYSPGYGEAPSHGAPAHHTSPHHHSTGASAHGAAVGSPGVGSGNGLLAPLDIPINVCGNTIDVIGLLNPVFGNSCAEHTPEATSVHRTPPHTPHGPSTPHAPHAPHSPHSPHTPGHPVPGEDRAIPPTPSLVPNDPRPHLPESRPVVQAPAGRAVLAQTGSDFDLLTGAGMSAALLIGGGILYRRSRARARV